MRTPGMGVSREFQSCTIQLLRYSCSRPGISLRARFSSTSTPHSRSGRGLEDISELFEYTSGRWIYNEALRRSERKRVFHVSEFKRLAAESVGRSPKDIVRFEKLAEGGFNRTFLITIRDGFQFVARIPYPVTVPKYFVVASEAATMDFLRCHGIPVPQIYGYSATANNTAGTEYIFMEFVRARNLGDVWFDMSEKSRIRLVANIVEVENRMFNYQFSASGSLYYTKDLQATSKKLDISGTDLGNSSRFCIGPDTTPGLWYGKRSNLAENRGPHADIQAVLAAGAQKEIAYLKKFGRPLHPFQRLRREMYNYQKQSPSEHLDILDKYLRVSPYLIPDKDKLKRHIIRHPDLQPNNIFVSDEYDIVALVDWQHCSILPLFLQSGIPTSFQNYGDSVSESLQVPELQGNFEELEDKERLEQAEIFRRRQLHHLFVTETARLNRIHYEALTHDFSTLRRKLFHHASDPWEGDNVTLKADLIQMTKNWSDITTSACGHCPPCPILFREDESTECLRLNAEQVEADEQLDACTNLIGVGPEGWVPLDQYEGAKECSTKLKADTLGGVETDLERAKILEHWPFDNHDEDEYL